MASRQAVLGMEQASFFYGSARVFENVSFLLDDARTALVGDNGAGKSTLLKCLGGQLELDGGQVIRSRGLKVGILPQDIPEGLSERPLRDVLGDALQRAGLGDDLWRIDVLADEIGVAQETLDKPFGTLSGGWQRLLLIAAAARLEEPDILILDEPTNHLDIDSRAALIESINDYEGAVILVSHDRHLLDACADRLWLVANRAVTPFDGDLDDYRRRVLSDRSEPAAKRHEKDDRTAKANGKPADAKPRVNVKALKKQVEKAEAEIERLKAAQTRVIDLGGRTVIPGLIDNHAHWIRAAEHDDAEDQDSKNRWPVTGIDEVVVEPAGRAA